MYSTGRKNRTVTLSNGQTANINYYFVSLFFIFNFTADYKYSLVTPGDDGSVSHKAITKDEIAKLNDGHTPKPPVLERYSFLIIVGIAAVAWLVRTIVG